METPFWQILAVLVELDSQNHGHDNLHDKHVDGGEE